MIFGLGAIQTTAAALALGLALGAAGAWWQTRSAVNDRWEARWAERDLQTARALAEAAAAAHAAERRHAEIANRLEVQHAEATQRLATVQADLRRAVRDAGGRLRDPHAVAPACPVPAAADAAQRPAEPAPAGDVPAPAGGVVLSDQTTAFLLDLAADADAAAEYAATCHAWVRALREARRE